jgi:hypothetical protein
VQAPPEMTNHHLQPRDDNHDSDSYAVADTSPTRTSDRPLEPDVTGAAMVVLWAGA